MSLKKSFYRARIALEGLKGNTGMVPPESMVFIGNGDFLQIGREFRNHLIDLAGLLPDSRVLDVGCGIGRMAIPLTEYLTTKGEYAGVDIVEKGILWCTSRITPKFPNFRFVHSDIHNKMYNRRGKTLARNYRFPYADGHFDVVFLTSVFTHMLPADLENYMREIARVLKKGGRCLMTFLLRNDESVKLIDAGACTGAMAITHHVEAAAWTSDPEKPEAATAYEERYVVELCERTGLRIDRPIRYGSWCGRGEFLSFQDIVVVAKT